MSKQWVRQEIKKNEIADFLAKAAAWALANRQRAVGIAGGMLAVVIGGIYIVNQIFQNQDTAWERLAFAQSYAYQGQPAKAIEQLKLLEDQFSQTPASGFGMLFAGDILFRAGQYKEAATTYQRLLDRQSPKQTMPLAMSDLGLSQEAAEDCKSAVETNQRFLDAYADHFLAPQAHASLARCLDLLGLKDKPKATYERMALLYPDSYWAQWAQTRLKS